MKTTISITGVRKIALIAGVVALVSALERESLAQGTVCPDNGTVRVCLQWSRATPPQEITDFELAFGGNGAEIQLKSGDLEWVIYAEIMATGEPADITWLTIDPSSSSENFVVTLANGLIAGARNVGEINLTATNWAGDTALVASHISGDLVGDLEVNRNELSEGGGLDLVIDGDIGPTSTVSAQTVIYLQVGGFPFLEEPPGYIWGNLVFPNSIPSGSLVIAGYLEGTIDLGNGYLGGYLTLHDGGHGEIINGGTIITGGGVYLGCFYPEDSWAGAASFDTMEPGALISMADSGSISGSIAIVHDMEGSIEIEGPGLLTGGLLDIGGRLAGNIWFTSGDVAGHMRIGGDVNSIYFAPSIIINGSLSDYARISMHGSLLDSWNGHEIEIGEKADSSAVSVDYDGWDANDNWEQSATILIGSTTFDGNTPSARVWEIQPCRGDMDNDGDVDNFDIDPFVAALSDPAVYEADYPGLEGSMVYHGDCDCDGHFNNFDIDPFVDLVVGNCCDATCPGCSSFARGGGGPDASEIAATLAENVASERFDALLDIVSEVATSEEPTAEFWGEVLEALGG